MFWPSGSREKNMQVPKKNDCCVSCPV